MKFRVSSFATVCGAVSLLLAIGIAPMRAATVNFNLSGRVTGVSDVVVGASHFNITFSAGGLSYDTAYSGNAITYPNAVAIRDALIVILNGLFPNVPHIAVPDATVSAFIIPLSLTASGDVEGPYAVKGTLPTQLYQPQFTLGPVPHDEPRQDTLAWTYVSETPLPATLPLFITGLGALGLIGWRRKQKHLGRKDPAAAVAMG